MDLEKTVMYYLNLQDESLCSCAYCRNYYREIRGAYPELSAYLAGMGVDIEKPFEAIPIELYEDKMMYMGAQYIVMGQDTDFQETEVSGVHLSVAESHPTTEIEEDHFVIEVSSVTLKWTPEGNPDADC